MSNEEKKVLEEILISFADKYDYSDDEKEELLDIINDEDFLQTESHIVNLFELVFFDSPLCNHICYDGIYYLQESEILTVISNMDNVKDFFNKEDIIRGINWIDFTCYSTGDLEWFNDDIDILDDYGREYFDEYISEINTFKSFINGPLKKLMVIFDISKDEIKPFYSAMQDALESRAEELLECVREFDVDNDDVKWMKETLCEIMGDKDYYSDNSEFYHFITIDDLERQEKRNENKEYDWLTDETPDEFWEHEI